MNGALIVDKPSGPTSHDVVAAARRALRIRRIGHTGTLDPLATGVLVLLLGKATRLAQFLVGDEKEYVADVRLGIATETYDAASLPEEVRRKADSTLQLDDLDRLLDDFRGTFLQTPPAFSAKKVAGARAYEHARNRAAVELQAVQVTVNTLEVLSNSPDGLLRLRIVCSSGFYVRSLAHDLGQRLGCGAHLEALRRTRVGRFSIADAMTLDAIEVEGPDRLIPLQAVLDDIPALTVSEEGARRAAHGNWLAPEHIAGGGVAVSAPSRVRVLDAAGDLLAVADRKDDALLHPVVVLV